MGTRCLWSYHPILKFLLIGTVNSGKTSLLNKLYNGKYVYSPIDKSEYFFGSQEEIFSVDIESYSNGMLTRKYYPNANGIILMIDSNNKKMLEENKEGIEGYLLQEDYDELPVLILNNIKGGVIEVTEKEISELFHFERQKRMIKVINCNCLSLENVWDGIKWLRKNAIKSKGI